MVNRNLAKIESNGLASFLSKTHLTIMKNRTIIRSRFHVYLKFVFERRKEKKQIIGDDLEIELARDPVAESTRDDEAGRGLELDSVNLPGAAPLNQSSHLMRGMKEDLKFTISAQSVQEELEGYKAFIKEEDEYLATMIRNRLELHLVQDSIRETGKKL